MCAADVVKDDAKVRGSACLFTIVVPEMTLRIAGLFWLKQKKTH